MFSFCPVLKEIEYQEIFSCPHTENVRENEFKMKIFHFTCDPITLESKNKYFQIALSALYLPCLCCNLIMILIINDLLMLRIGHNYEYRSAGLQWPVAESVQIIL